MELILPRYTSRSDSVGGLMFVDNQHHSYTCEDQHQEVKVPGETCIPEGRYQIKLRDVGGLTRKYAEIYPFHKDN